MRGQWFHVWCEFVDEHNTGVPAGSFHRYRDSWMTYAHYRANGELVDDWGWEGALAERKKRLLAEFVGDD